jgi:murein DD-endopeptidase MepM/ murein hydrolase activator NlpD
VHYIISKLIIIFLTTLVLLVSGCSGFGTFNSKLSPAQAKSMHVSSNHLDMQESLAHQRHSVDGLVDGKMSSAQKQEDIFETSNTFVQTSITSDTRNWITHTIEKGQTLSKILSQYGVSPSETITLVKSSKLARSLRNIQVGQDLRLLVSNDLTLLELEYKRNQTETIKISKTDAGFLSEIVSADVTREQLYVLGTIHNSLFADAKSAGLSDSLIMRLADVFAWDIDFALHIHDGDTFAVLYEQQSIDGKPVGSGEILAAEFINHGKAYRAVRYKDSRGHVDYYTPDGKGLRQAFLRAPVKFSRISSRFSSGRKHPILNRIRAHKGVDYAARSGTPIRATGDGRIIHRGRKGGYGKVVILKHGSSYSTLYAHLSKYKRNQRVGSTVKQGDIIGYVGKTGLATGPHLHYEFRVAGVHKNPLTVKLSKSISIPKKQRETFQNQTQPLLAEMDKQNNIVLASSSTEK